MILSAMDLNEVINAWWLYLVGGIVTIFIILGCLVFARKAYKQSKELGMDKEKIKKAVVSSISFSVLPSIGIFVGVITMSGAIGVPLPWIRLSVLGAIHYELLAVDTATGVLGVVSVQDFVTVAFTMTIAIIWGCLFVLFLFKRYQKRISGSEKNEEQDENKRSFAPFIFQSVFIGMVSVYFGRAFSHVIVETSDDYQRTLLPLIVFVVSYVSMMFFDWLVNKKNIKWLESFQLSFSMLIGMTSAVLFGLGGVL